MKDGSSPPNSTAMDSAQNAATDIPPTNSPDPRSSTGLQGVKLSPTDQRVEGVEPVQGGRDDSSGASQPGEESSSDRGGTESPDRGNLGGRLPFARRIEDPQRVDGGGRWSVDSTRRRCCRCHKDLPDDQTFDTVLEPATVEDSFGEEDTGTAVERRLDSRNDEVSDLFARRDYCAACFQADPPPTYFAHWRRVLPPPAAGPKKVVNLVSLLSHFHQLVETPAVSESEREDLASEGMGGSTARSPLEPHVPALSPERLRLAYLLALFLVRRRMLKWEAVGEEALRLRCKESDRPVDLPLPVMSKEALEEAMEQFEDLFR